MLLRTSALICESLPLSFQRDTLPAKGLENLSLLGCQVCGLHILSQISVLIQKISQLCSKNITVLHWSEIRRRLTHTETSAQHFRAKAGKECYCAGKLPIKQKKELVCFLKQHLTSVKSISGKFIGSFAWFQFVSASQHL